MTTRVELTLEIETGLTEAALESMFREQFSNEIVDIDVEELEG